MTEQPRIGFEDLFLNQVWSSERELRQMLVVTLMSVLEMVKLGVLGVYQAQGSDTISLERAVEIDRMHHVIDDFREDDEMAPAPAAGASDVELEAIIDSGTIVEHEAEPDSKPDRSPPPPPETEIMPELITSPPVPEPERDSMTVPEPEREPMIEPMIDPPAEPESEPMIDPPAEPESEPIRPPPQPEREPIIEPIIEPDPEPEPITPPPDTEREPISDPEPKREPMLAPEPRSAASNDLPEPGDSD